MKLFLFLLLTLLPALLHGEPLPAGSEPRPNIVLMMTDDQGWGDLSMHGNPRLETPNLDKLGSESVRFANFYVNPACAPTRASLLTGRHFHRGNVWGVHEGRDYLSPEETLISEILRDAGYRTGMIGKWHNGKSGAYLPWNRGFQQAWSKSGLYNHDRATFNYNGEPMEREGWAREVIADLAIEFMTEHQDEPFFLYLPFPTPHLQALAPEEIIQKYRDKGCGEALAKYYAMMDHLDQCIGRIMQGINDLGLRDETIVLFLSDNGPQGRGQTEEEFAERNPQGWRGSKGGIWENGVRSPLFMRAPGWEPREIQTLAHVTDLFPTLRELTGATTQTLHKPLDGRSLVALLNGREDAALEDRYVYNAEIVPSWEGRQDYTSYLPDRDLLEYEDQSAFVRQHDMKLMKRGSDYRLYDLANDPGETTDIAADHPELVERLKARLDAWFEPIITDPSLFTESVLQIGYPGEETAQLWMVCAHEKSPEIDSYVWVKEMNQAGQYLRMPVDVLTAGRYAVGVHGTLPKGSKWRVQVGAQTLDTVIESGSGGDVALGELDLPETGRFPLNLEVLEVPDGGEKNSHIFYLTFTALDRG